MPTFKSKREKRLWVWTIFLVLTIYCTLGLANRFVIELSNRDILTPFFILSLVLVVIAVFAIGMKARPRGLEIGMGIGILAIYLLVVLRTIISEGRGHLIEYSIIAALIYEALKERKEHGGKVPYPALTAIVATTFLGFIDEGIQSILPSRVFGFEDIGFNFFAAAMAVSACAALNWARERG